MYLTAQRVWSRVLRRSAIHAFFYRHPTPLSAPVDVSKIAFRNPGELVASHVELPPGGNEVHSYLDIASAGDLLETDLENVIAALTEGTQPSSKPPITKTLEEVAARFHWTSPVASPASELAELASALRALYSKARHAEPLIIRVARSASSVRYSLDPSSATRVRELMGPRWPTPPAISVDVDTLAAFEAARGSIHHELIPLLTGLNASQLHAIGGVSVVTDSGAHLADGGENASPPFPESDVSSCLASDLPARRTRGFALAEGAIGQGAAVPDSVLRLVESIALDVGSLRSDRWRAIDFLRNSVLRPEIRSKLLKEWSTAPESSVAPLEYDSGPMPMVLQEGPSCIDEILNSIDRRPLSQLNRFAVRDVLVAMRAHLLSNAESIWEDQALRWKRFALRAIREREPAQMAPNDGLLVESIVKLTDDQRARGHVDHAAALWAFDQLRLQNAHVEVRDLWHLDGEYRVHVPELSAARSRDGQTSLSEWFRRNHPLSVRIELSSEPPEGWEKVDERTLEQFIQPVGSLRPVRDAVTDLSLALPRDFPDFDVLSDPLRVVTSRALDADEATNLERVWKTLHLPLPYRTTVIPHFVPPPFPRRPQADIDLIPSRRLPPEASNELRRLVEADEDAWMTHRSDLYSDKGLGSRVLLPDDWKRNVGRCIVPTSAFPAQNIRNYLSLYREVILVCPLAIKMDEVVTSLRCNSSDLVKLLASGRVRLLLPQSVDRYDLRFLSEAAEAAPQSLLFSRALGICTVAEARERVPLLYPLLSPLERTMLVRALVALAEQYPDPEQSNVVRATAFELARIYADAELWLHRQGAMVSMQAGIGTLLAAIWRAARGKDFLIEFSAAAPTVEWGALFNATVFPVESPSYSEARACELIASAYSGVDQGARAPAPSELQEVLTDVLTVDNDAPLQDFIDAFAGSDVDRLRSLMVRLTSENADIDARRAAVEEFNRAVRRYEKSIEKTKSWDMVGLLQAFGPLLLPGPAKYAGIGAWFLRRLVAGQDLGRIDSPSLARIVDRLNAPLVAEGSEIVLVSRLKKKLGAIA